MRKRATQRRRQTPAQPIRDERRIQELQTMPYLDYLRTPEWEAKRQQVLDRDGYKCRVCNSTEQLNVHHRTYERRGDEDLNDLTTLCDECHKRFHREGVLHSAPKVTRSASDVLHSRIYDYKNKLLQTFDCTLPGVQSAFEQASHYVTNYEGVWLIISGGNFTGKTHLAAGIANEFIKQSKSVCFAFPGDLLDMLLNNSGFSLNDIIETVQNADLLVFDDYGAHNQEEGPQETLMQLLVYRCKNGLPVVITTSKTTLKLPGNSRTVIRTASLRQAKDYRPKHI